MKRRTMLFVLPASVAVAGLGIAGDASAQGTKSVAGTYAPVSVLTIDAAGKKSDVFGPRPRGQLTLSADGRYSLILMRASLPKFASKSRLKGTADENKDIVAGSIAHFGRYTIDDKAGTVTFHVESSTYPNWDGEPQTRPFTAKGDTFVYKVATVSGATGSGEVTWKRVK